MSNPWIHEEESELKKDSTVCGILGLDCKDTELTITTILLITGYYSQVWIEVGDIILVSLREFEADKADIIHKYYRSEASALIEAEEIPNTGTSCNHTGVLYMCGRFKLT